MRVFLQSSERDGQAMIKNPRYFVLELTGGKLESVTAPPEWATDYWRWKSDKAAPGSRAFSIDVKKEERTSTPTSAPMGGALARGGSDLGGAAGTSADDVAMRAQQMQKQQVISLTLKSETVGEFVNQQFLPGYTFGWAPESSGPMIAYRNQAGRLSVMDEQGQKQEIAGTKDVILPAWSADGAKIAFLQKREEQLRPRDREHEIMTRSGRCGLASTGLVAYSRDKANPDMGHLATLLLTVVVAQFAAQPPAQDQTQPFRTGVQAVEVDVRVIAKNGQFVTDLTPDDFQLFEDGVPQRILSAVLVTSAPLAPAPAAPPAPPAPALPAPFAPSAPSAPSVWVFVFDTTHLTPGSLQRSRDAVVKFIADRFHDGDVAGIIADGRMANNRLTSNREELQAAAAAIKIPGQLRSRQLELREWPRLQDELEAFRIVNQERDALRRPSSGRVTTIRMRARGCRSTRS